MVDFSEDSYNEINNSIRDSLDRMADFYNLEVERKWNLTWFIKFTISVFEFNFNHIDNGVMTKIPLNKANSDIEIVVSADLIDAVKGFMTTATIVNS